MTLFAEFRVEVGSPVVPGNDGYGEARIIPILGGTVSGISLSGTILPGGADEQRFRADGLTRIQARLSSAPRTGVSSGSTARAFPMPLPT